MHFHNGELFIPSEYGADLIYEMNISFLSNMNKNLLDFHKRNLKTSEESKNQFSFNFHSKKIKALSTK